ncbi:hypothetical protein TNCV_4958161 [Trichonephila clavipes]|nr:hypothetical protein TNCV_4958161 [Trichonephila clavipes]
MRPEVRTGLLSPVCSRRTREQLGRYQKVVKVSESRVQTSVGLPMRKDEGRVVDPHLNFKKVVYRESRLNWMV